jgi:hypothetical protein
VFEKAEVSGSSASVEHLLRLRRSALGSVDIARCLIGMGSVSGEFHRRVSKAKGKGTLTLSPPFWMPTSSVCGIETRPKTK